MPGITSRTGHEVLPGACVLYSVVTRKQLPDEDTHGKGSLGSHFSERKQDWADLTVLYQSKVSLEQRLPRGGARPELGRNDQALEPLLCSDPAGPQRPRLETGE